jgi:hypothetical protein
MAGKWSGGQIVQPLPFGVGQRMLQSLDGVADAMRPSRGANGVSNCQNSGSRDGCCNALLRCNGCACDGGADDL